MGFVVDVFLVSSSSSSLLVVLLWLSLEFEPSLVPVAVFELGREAKNLSRPGQQILFFCWDNVCSWIGEEGRRGSEYTSVAVAGGAKESIRVRSIRVSPPGAAPRV